MFTYTNYTCCLASRMPALSPFLHKIAAQVANIARLSSSSLLRRKDDPKKEAKANHMKEWHYENKLLYGKVLKNFDPSVKRREVNARHTKQRKTVTTSVNSAVSKIESKRSQKKYIDTKLNVDPLKKEQANGITNSDSVKTDVENFTTEPHGSFDSELSNVQMPDEKADEQYFQDILLFPLFQTEKSSAVYNPINPSKVLHVDLPKVGLGPGELPKRPSVTNILAATRSPEAQFFLDRWEKQMIAELGEEGFKQYKQGLFRRGKNLHSCIEDHLGGKSFDELSLLPENEGHWKSIQAVLPDVSNIEIMEQWVQHPHLGYGGILDCLARYKDTLCLIDWKTSQKPKPKLENTFDNPLQVVAYLGALNFDDSHNFKVENTMIVIAYPDGQPAHAHFMTRGDCVKYWGHWLHRLHAYWLKTVTH